MSLSLMVSYLVEILHVVFRSHEYDRLLLRLHDVTQKIQQQRRLVIQTQVKKRQLRKKRDAFSLPAWRAT